MGLNIKDLRIGSPAFTALEPIPKRYTIEGENILPPLEWSGLPSGTQRLVLICHDPDAPLVRGFTHWTIYNIPPTVTGLAEAGGSKYHSRHEQYRQPGVYRTCTTKRAWTSPLLFLAVRLRQRTRPQTRLEPRTTSGCDRRLCD